MPIPEPHGGVLQDLVARDVDLKQNLLDEARKHGYVVLKLSERQLCDLELILNGGFSPLTGFMNEEDYKSVVNEMRLTSVIDQNTKKGLLWPIPITLDVNAEFAGKLKVGEKLVLQDPRDGNLLSILDVQSIYKPDKAVEAKQVFRGDPEHPAVKYLYDTAGEYYVGGSLQGLQYPVHYDYVDFRKNPLQLREEFKSLGWDTQKIVAFQTRNPMHRAHRELTVRAAKDLGDDGHILVHPVVGLTKPGDIDHHTRVKVYQQILKKYPQGLATISLLPLAMRMGGDREALWHALIRMNYGVDHFIVGRDHAGPGKNSNGVEFYGPYDAQELLQLVELELAGKIKIVPFRMVTYIPDEDRYAPIDTIDLKTVKTADISGTELRLRLKEGSEIPEWFSYPEVVQVLRESYPPRSKQGFAILIASENAPELSESLVNALQTVLNQFHGGRRITKLLGKYADLFVTSELVKSGSGVLLASPGDLADIVTAVGQDNTKLIKPVETDLVSDIIVEVVEHLKSQGFYQ